MAIFRFFKMGAAAVLHFWNPSTGLTCRWVPQKRGINKNFGYISSVYPAVPPWTDMHLGLIWHSRRGRRRNHLWQMFWWSVEGCPFSRWSKIAISHWQSQSPLRQGWRYRAACDTMHTLKSTSCSLRDSQHTDDIIPMRPQLSSVMSSLPQCYGTCLVLLRVGTHCPCSR